MFFCSSPVCEASHTLKQIAHPAGFTSKAKPGVGAWAITGPGSSRRGGDPMELKASDETPTGPPLVDHSDRLDAGKMFLRLAGVTTPAPSGGTIEMRPILLARCDQSRRTTILLF